MTLHRTLVSAFCVASLCLVIEAQTVRTPRSRRLPSIVRLSPAVLQRRVTYRVDPILPSGCRCEGTVTVDLKVDDGGNVVSVTYVKGHPLLAQPAIAAARQWKFQQLSLSGVPIGFYGSLELVFSAPTKTGDLCIVVGQQVTLRGEFSMRGKIGPFILVAGSPVYLIARGVSSPGPSYESMEGKLVTLTGTLRFYKAPKISAGQLAEGRLPDHYYMEAENARVELVK